MYQVGSIEHKEMVGMVKGRLSRLAMCKRGVLDTERRARELTLGGMPMYTQEERERAFRLDSIRRYTGP